MAKRLAEKQALMDEASRIVSTLVAFEGHQAQPMVSHLIARHDVLSDLIDAFRHDLETRLMERLQEIEKEFLKP